MGLTFDMEWYRGLTDEHRERIADWANSVAEPFPIAVTLLDESCRRGHIEVIDMDATTAAREADPNHDEWITYTLYDQTFIKPFPIT